MMWVLVLWLALCFLVGLFANMRGRDGIGWFTVAIVISPFIAGILVFALPRKELPFDQVATGARPTSPDRQLLLSTFRPDGVYAGIAYMVTQDCAIVAITSKGLVRFRDIDHFLTAVAEKAAA